MCAIACIYVCYIYISSLLYQVKHRPQHTHETICYSHVTQSNTFSKEGSYCCETGGLTYHSSPIIINRSWLFNCNSSFLSDIFTSHSQVTLRGHHSAPIISTSTRNAGPPVTQQF
uniref:Uncharacterized protein n=1 Tax=Octopus bimaculoides TaxID=37653 RepID=A0A0L8HVK9_OCTBM